MRSSKFDILEKSSNLKYIYLFIFKLIDKINRSYFHFDVLGREN